MWLIAFIALIAVLIYAPYALTAIAVGGVVYMLYKLAVPFTKQPVTGSAEASQGGVEAEAVEVLEETLPAPTALVEDAESDEEFLARQRAMNFTD